MMPCVVELGLSEVVHNKATQLKVFSFCFKAAGRTSDLGILTGGNMLYFDNCLSLDNVSLLQLPMCVSIDRGELSTSVL